MSFGEMWYQPDGVATAQRKDVLEPLLERMWCTRRARALTGHRMLLGIA